MAENSPLDVNLLQAGKGPAQESDPSLEVIRATENIPNLRKETITTLSKEIVRAS